MEKYISEVINESDGKRAKLQYEPRMTREDREAQRLKEMEDEMKK